MNIVIAPDSFKGNLTAMQVAQAIEQGVRCVLPDANCIAVPMADGGEGTVQSLVDATGGRFVHRTVTGPAGAPVNARYGILRDGVTAVIEMAEASGLPLVKGTDRNPLRTTTFGTGELLADAMKRGARRIIVGIGGSATNDAGAGMAQALGVVFSDGSGRAINGHASGGMLNRIAHIQMSGINKRLRQTAITVACDVDNPLCGPRGASHVFGPQKGATPAMEKTLDGNLRYFGGLIKKELGMDVQNLKGAGAAGGLGGGLVAFCNAELRSGVDIVIDATGLRERLRDADLVITGEGRVDFQTAFGKTPAGVARAAGQLGVPVLAIGGGLADDARGVFAHGIDALESTVTRDMSLEEALAHAHTFIVNAAERALRLILVGRNMTGKRRTRRGGVSQPSRLQARKRR
ncbi:MAG: glycerate kinase [Gammaproteobacteria bacterium]|nr:glycerate kinase [Gammaproteobacteria bacterium]